MPKVIVGIASLSHVVTEFAISLATLSAYVSPHYEYCGIINVQGTLIDQARNNIAHQFLTTDADWLMMFDTDVAMPIDTIDRLLQMHSECKSLVGSGWYDLRVYNSLKASVFYFNESGNMTYGSPRLSQTPYIEADMGPSGAMLIHRSVFEELKRSGEQYFFKFEHANGQTMTEDAYFCKLLKKYGYKFMVHRDVYFSHYKTRAL